MRVRRQHPEREDARYLEMRRAGRTYNDIALLCGVSYETAWSGVQRARLRQKPAQKPGEPVREPKLTLAFGSSCKPLRLLTCADVHPGGPMPSGSHCLCAACDKSGVESHPGLRRDPLTDPRPEPRPKPKAKSGRSTRKERRQATAA